MAAALDRRLNAYRGDLADIAFLGRVDAGRFVEGQPYHVTVTIAPVHPEPSHDADLDTQALRGEAVSVFEVADGWAWCQLAGDGYVGYVPADMLAAGRPLTATHRVASAALLAYTEPNARSRATGQYLFHSPLTVTSESGDFFQLADGSFVGRQHAAAIDARETDYVSTAHKFLGTPYLWGGKSARGIDCSGLVQLSLLGAGINCPRDTDMQARDLPGDLEISDDVFDSLQRGDLVYWPGHVGIMIDGCRLLHANGTNMATTIEPVREVAGRSRKGGPAVTAAKRLLHGQGATSDQ